MLTLTVSDICSQLCLPERDAQVVALYLQQKSKDLSTVLFCLETVFGSGEKASEIAQWMRENFATSTVEEALPLTLDDRNLPKFQDNESTDSEIQFAPSSSAEVTDESTIPFVDTSSSASKSDFPLHSQVSTTSQASGLFKDTGHWRTSSPRQFTDAESEKQRLFSDPAYVSMLRQGGGVVPKTPHRI